MAIRGLREMFENVNAMLLADIAGFSRPFAVVCALRHSAAVQSFRLPFNSSNGL